MLDRPRFQRLLDGVEVALGRARLNAPLVAAYERLRDPASQNGQGPIQPYTDGGIAALTKVFERNPDDVRVAHHLAIAHHARAWDRELSGEPGAEGDWRLALHYWRKVSFSAEYWEQLAAKFAQLDPRGNPAFVEQTRSRLFEHLLEVHVNFITYHIERGVPERAAVHIEVINSARIPPAVRSKLIGMVYEEMTEPVAEARAQKEYSSALLHVERFVNLFDCYFPALRAFIELASPVLKSMDLKSQWDEILDLGMRTQAIATRLKDHPDLESDSLARVCLVELCFDFYWSAYMKLQTFDTVSRLADDNDPDPLSESERDTTNAIFEFGRAWGTIGEQACAHDDNYRSNFCAYLGLGCNLFHVNSQSVFRAEDALAWERKALGCLKQIEPITPNDETLKQNIEALEEKIRNLEVRANLSV